MWLGRPHPTEGDLGNPQCSCQKTPRGLETRCGRKATTRPRGPSESPDGVDTPTLREQERHNVMVITVGSKYEVYVRSPAPSHMLTLEQPFRTLVVKREVNIFLKKSFLRLYHAFSFLRLYRCVAVDDYITQVPFFWVFGMTQPGIEPRFPGPLAKTQNQWAGIYLINFILFCWFKYFSQSEHFKIFKMHLTFTFSAYFFIRLRIQPFNFLKILSVCRQNTDFYFFSVLHFNWKWNVDSFDMKKDKEKKFDT